MASLAKLMSVVVGARFDMVLSLLPDMLAVCWVILVVV